MCTAHMISAGYEVCLLLRMKIMGKGLVQWLLFYQLLLPNNNLHGRFLLECR